MKEMEGEQESQGNGYTIPVQNFLPKQMPLSATTLPFYFMIKTRESEARPKCH